MSKQGKAGTCADCPFSADGASDAMRICRAGTKPDMVNASYWCARHPKRAQPDVLALLVAATDRSARLRVALETVAKQIGKFQTPINGSPSSWSVNTAEINRAIATCDDALAVTTTETK